MKTMGVNLCVLMLILGLSSCSMAKRSLLQSKPDLCDADTGKWEPDSINCDFDCDGSGWELDCECKDKDDCSVVECKVDEDGAPDSEDIEFYCDVNGSPVCDFSILDATFDNNQTCVPTVVKEVLSLWSPSED